MKKIILLAALLVVGCSSPVRRFRAISDSYHMRYDYNGAKIFLQHAEVAAFNGFYCHEESYNSPVDSVYPIAEAIKRIDRRFDISVQPVGLHRAVLTVAW